MPLKESETVKITKETETKTLSQIREYNTAIKNKQIKAITKKLNKTLQLDEVNSVKANFILEIAFRRLRLGTLPPPQENIQTKSKTEKDKRALLVKCPSPCWPSVLRLPLSRFNNHIRTCILVYTVTSNKIIVEKYLYATFLNLFEYGKLCDPFYCQCY